MEEVKVTITTNTPVSVKVIQTGPESGYLKLTEKLNKPEDKKNARKAK